MRISDWSSDVCSSDLVRHRKILAEAIRDQARRLRLGSRPINSTFEASKWRRYRVRAGAAGSIATRKAARARDRSHFGVPQVKQKGGFDRFCPGLRRKALKSTPIPTRSEEHTSELQSLMRI